MTGYGAGDSYLFCGFGTDNTCEWTVNKRVRTYGDFLLLAQKAFSQVATNIPAMAAVYNAYAKTPEKVLDGKGRALFNRSLPLPTMFASLRTLVSADKATKALVVAKAAEYYTNVEQKGAGAAPASSTAPAFQPSPASYAPVAAAALPATVTAEAPVEPFYKRPWFAPVAVLGTVGIAALFLLPKRGV